MLLLLLTLVGGTRPAGGASLSPDCVVVILDDLGFGDAEWTAQPGTGLPSPNLSRLAQSGTVLTSFYVQPACTPTRAALLTGLYPINTGMQDFVIKQTAPIGLPLEFELLPQRLQKRGYHTSLVGKWHLGFYETAYHPENRGFDHFFGMFTGDADHYSHQASSRVWLRGDDGEEVLVVSGTDLRDGSATVYPDTSVHSTDLYVSAAVRVVEECMEDEPLFLVLALQAVHFPLQVPTSLAQDPACTSLGQVTEAAVDEANRRTVCGMMLGVDRGVADLETAIRTHRRWDNTFFVVFSDNGGDNKWGTSNYPLRGHKDQVWEGGVRVPALLSGGLVEKATALSGSHSSAALTHVTDLHACILTLAGVGTPIATDGIDQWVAWVGGQEGARDELVYNINSDTFFGGGALRVGDYKLVIEWNSTVHDTVAAVMKVLASSSELPDELAVQRLVQGHLGENPHKYLFNVAKNPSEAEHGHCADVEACSNLLDQPSFADVLASLEQRYSDLQQSARAAVFDWQDDGPLAMPDLFAGFWSSWRDSHGVPLAIYETNSRTTRSTTAIAPTSQHDSTTTSNGSNEPESGSSSGGSGVVGSSRPHATIPGYSWSRPHQRRQGGKPMENQDSYWQDDMIGAAMFLMVCASVGLAVLYWYLAQRRRSALEWEELMGSSTSTRVVSGKSYDTLVQATAVNPYSAKVDEL